MLHSGAKCKWIPPNEFYAEMEKNDIVVGGERRMAFINHVYHRYRWCRRLEVSSHSAASR
jgi:hypothetical protein